MPTVAFVRESEAELTDLETTRSVLSLARVSVRFGGVAALIDIAMDVQSRELTAVVGPNGAGKTTLLNAICGMTRGGVNGQTSLPGQSISKLSPLHIPRAGVGRSF